nr:unnamed protein product [Callosobruchus chinensis]
MLGQNWNVGIASSLRSSVKLWLYLQSNFQNLEDLWQTDGTGIGIFRATMSLQRFRFLLRCLRFDDLNTRGKRIILDKFALFRFFFEAFVQNC